MTTCPTDCQSLSACTPETLLEFGNGVTQPLPGANGSPFSYFYLELPGGVVLPGKDGGVVTNPDGGIVMSPMPHTQTLSPDVVRGEVGLQGCHW
jgi:hypothetical protein